MILKKLLILTRRYVKGADLTLQKRYPQYSIGKASYGPLRVRDWGEGAKLSIGNFTSIAAGVQVFLGGEHRMDWVTTFPFNVLWPSAKGILGHPKTKGDVCIGNDVWIGTEAMIMSGVTIGDGAVVGARALVVKDVPPYAVVTGNPAKVVKYRFDNQTIEKLLKIKWWDWSEDRINEMMPKMLNNNIEEFIRNVGM